MLKEVLGNLSVNLPYARLNLVQHELMQYPYNSKVLDLGCGDGYSTAIMVKSLRKRFYIVGFDAYEDNLRLAEQTGVYGLLLRADIREIEGRVNPADIVLLCEILEHISKEDGYKLLYWLEKIAHKCIIITSPPHLNRNREGRSYEEDVKFREWLHKDKPWTMPHVSVWKSADYEKLGYQVYGANGAYIRGLPYAGMILAKWAYCHPDYANSIVAIKRMGEPI